MGCLISSSLLIVSFAALLSTAAISSVETSYGLEGTSGDHRVQHPAKAGSLQEAAQVSVQVGLNISREGDHSLSGKLVPVVHSLKVSFSTSGGTSWILPFCDVLYLSLPEHSAATLDVQPQDSSPAMYSNSQCF